MPLRVPATGGAWSVMMSVQTMLMAVGVAILCYETSAKRANSGEPHAALVSRTDVRLANEWKLVFHQQAPLAHGHRVTKVLHFRRVREVARGCPGTSTSGRG